ncbi:MAG: thermonuclease family protein [Alphaproteobacteria bacterium GM7ARS4]|nr:thermonuclease family protein [Alphaproteobacteria bacterium GM7ARS4]
MHPLRVVLFAVLWLWGDSAVHGGYREAEQHNAPDINDAGGMEEEAEGIVHHVIDGDTLVLSDGRVVRLLGINASELHPHEMEGARAARDMLTSLVEGQPISLHFHQRKKDRHGRLLAHVCRTRDHLWIEAALLEGGNVWVYSFADNVPPLIETMLSLEGKARTHKKGVWQYPSYGVLSASDTLTDDVIGTFRLVEGVIKETALVGDTLYLNFGDDWRTDFTIRINKKAHALFQKEKLYPLTWKEHAIRVRGWLRRVNGVLIEVSHPQQIERLASAYGTLSHHKIGAGGIGEGTPDTPSSKTSPLEPSPLEPSPLEPSPLEPSPCRASIGLPR